MTTKPTLPTLLAAMLCSSALVMPAARAQWNGDYGYDWGGYGSGAVWRDQSFLSLRILNDTLHNHKNAGLQTSSPGVRRTPKTRAVTTYRASRTVSQKVQARLLALVAKSNSPATVAQLKRDLQGDVVGKWAKQVASDGLHGGDVVDAVTANWVQSWQVANDVMETQPAQVRAVRRQLARILSSNAAFARLSNAKRQEMAEGFIYSQVLQGSAYLDAVKRGDKTRQKQISDATHAGFKRGVGLDLRRVKLTSAGFAAKS